MRSPASAYTELFCQRVALHPNLRVLVPSPVSGLCVAKEFVVMLPVTLDFAHDALEFGISTQLVPVFVALEPGKIVISKLNGPSQPRESYLLLTQ